MNWKPEKINQSEFCKEMIQHHNSLQNQDEVLFKKKLSILIQHLVKAANLLDNEMQQYKSAEDVTVLLTKLAQIENPKDIEKKLIVLGWEAPEEQEYHFPDVVEM